MTKIVKHFSHDDDDGCGAIVVSKCVFRERFTTVDYETCTHSNINNRVRRFINELFEMEDPQSKYLMVVITDISVSTEVAELINEASQVYPEILFYLVDHHTSALWLNKYKWADVSPTTVLAGATVKTAATSLWFDRLMKNGYTNSMPNDEIRKLYEYVENVRQWDTWEWIDNGNQHALDMHTLHSIKGIKCYIQRFSENPDITFTEPEQLLVNEENLRIDRYVEDKKKEVFRTKTASGLTMGVVYAENHISIVGSKICRSNPDIDIVAILTPHLNRVSFRTIRNDINLGDLAVKFAGGGHPNASGCPFSNFVGVDMRLDVI